ncbi:P-loop ATPase, Sll1717 family [Aeromonas salmonicida]|uniref:P-loop ATPase, Sll1717 family n=1 Tax=Aeromonas salmonicida TaxID=645 RepID=UPI003D1FCC38
MTETRERPEYPIDFNFYDENLFGNEAGEDEDPEVLSSYFITKEKFNKFLSLNRNFGIVRARKGMGKSSLLSKLAFDVSNTDKRAIVISVTGADLLSYGNFEDHDHLKLQNEWKKALSARINYELGSKIGFAWTDTQMALVEASELVGYKGKNLVGSLLSRIKSKNIPIEFISPTAKDSRMLLERYMFEKEDADIWLFVDDIDSTFAADEIQKARVSSFFSACRALARDLKGVKIRASVRTDVWTTIRYNEDLDKCEQYVIDINWSRTELEKIISNKILSYLNRHHANLVTKQWNVDRAIDREQLISLVFMEKLRWSGSQVSPFTPIRIFGAKRPRWMSQLCRLSAEAAADREMKRVSIQDVNYILSDFGRLRVNDIYKEHSHQFNDLQKLIETFSKGQKRYSTEQLLDKIQSGFVDRVGIGGIGKVDSEDYIRPQQIAQLLFRIGFVLLREVTNPGSPPHFIDFDERPELLTDPSMDYALHIWEVHPSYRGILGIS